MAKSTYFFITMMIIGHAAQAINPGHSGAWFDPHHTGQGMILEVVPSDHQLVVYWFTFDESGERTWLVGQGAYDGDAAELQFVVAEGGRFLSDDPVELISAGQGRLTALSCTALQVEYEGASIQYLELSRLAPSAGCSTERRMGGAEFAQDHDNDLIALRGQWTSNDCIAVDSTSSMSHETFTFSADALTIDMTRHNARNCTGPGQSLHLDLSFRTNGRATALLGGEQVPVTRIDMIDTTTGSMIRQVLYIRHDGSQYQLTHGVFAGDGGRVDAAGYPLELHDQFLQLEP